MQPERYSSEFYQQVAPVVAPALLGAVLVRMIDGRRVSGKIVETEAYHTQDDLASHARSGKKPRNLPMWEMPGRAYVYFTYGMHWLFNVVCEPENHPAAVLIRALEPLEGLDLMAHHRAGRKQREWTSGPARLTQALQISGVNNRADLTSSHDSLWIESGERVSPAIIEQGARIGLGNVPEPWLSIGWRWWIRDNPYVSR